MFNCIINVHDDDDDDDDADDDFLSPNQSTASVHSHQKGYAKLSYFFIQRLL